MRLAITLGRTGDKWTVIEEPSKDIHAHKKAFKEALGKEGHVGHHKFHEIVSFSSDKSLNRHHTFDTDEQKQAHLKRQEEDQKKFEAAQKEREAEQKKLAEIEAKSKHVAKPRVTAAHGTAAKKEHATKPHATAHKKAEK